MPRRRSGGKTRQRRRDLLGADPDPRFAREDIDLMVVPAHDPAVGRNVFRTLGAVHRVTAKRLHEDAHRFAPLFASLPRPLVAVLLGGDNRVYRMTDERFAAFADRLAALNTQGYGLAITPSRRTDPRLVDLLRDRLAERMTFVWDRTGANPYFGLLGLADAIVATADSVSMVSEAAATAHRMTVNAIRREATMSLASRAARWLRIGASSREDEQAGKHDIRQEMAALGDAHDAEKRARGERRRRRPGVAAAATRSPWQRRTK